MANPPTADNAKKIGRAGRKRRFTGWTLLLLGLLVAAVWGASGWWMLRYYSGDLLLGCTSGSFIVRTAPNTMSAQHVYLNRRGAPEWSWWSGWSSERFFGTASGDEQGGWQRGPIDYSYNVSPNYRNRHLSFAFWPIPLIIWTPAVMLLRSGILAQRRAMIGMCAKCGYSLAGLAPDAPCPECGKGVKVTA